MLRLTLRQVRADGLRLLLSSLAIVLGVAFVAGTLMFTDGMRAGAYERAGEFDRHTDLAAYAETDPLPRRSWTGCAPSTGWRPPRAS